MVQPVTPVFAYPIFLPPFPNYGFGLGFNPLWWQGCSPFWGWGFACNNLSYYGYGGFAFGNSLYGQSELYEPPLPAYQPLYVYGAEAPRELVELYLKDGTVYQVTDYWLVDNQLHFTTTEGDKSVEHVIPFEQLDLQKTVDVNTQRGFHFVLRNAPIEQYLQDNSHTGTPSAPPTGVLQVAPQGPASPAAPEAPPQAPAPTAP